MDHIQLKFDRAVVDLSVICIEMGYRLKSIELIKKIKQNPSLIRQFNSLSGVIDIYQHKVRETEETKE